MGMMIPRRPDLPARLPGGLTVPGGPPALPQRPVVDAIPVPGPPANVPRLPGPPQPVQPGRFPWEAVGAAAGLGGLGAGIRWLLGGDEGQPADPAPPAAPAAAPPAAPAAAGQPPQRQGWENGMSPQLLRRQYLRQRAKRFRNEIAANPQIMADFEAGYDEAMRQPGATHRDAVRSLYNMETGLHAHQDAQRQLNVQNQAKQYNVAQQLGVPRGWVMAHDDVAQSLNKGDMATASAKASMYAHMYGPTWLYAAQQITSQHAARQEAEGRKAEAEAKAKPPEPNPVESVQQMTAQIAAMPAGPARASAIDTFHRTRLGGASAPPEQVQAAVRGHYQPIVREYARRGFNTLAPDEKVEFQQMTAGMKYPEWLQYTGLPEGRESADQYSALYGKNATWGQFFARLTPWDD